ncbi:MAG TPA: hypothetical protein VKK30_06605 [Actinomycetota bacterium]|nr:hypothetical protein [Actinomycetota bacterium]
MSQSRRMLGLPTAGMAAAGVVLGHWLTYFIAFPKPFVRMDVLARSGHGYWLFAVQVAVVLGVVGIGSLFLSRIRSMTQESMPELDRFARSAFRLAALQVAAFTAMEVVERLLAGASVAGIYQHHLFVFGLAIQLFVAVAGAVILRWFGQTATRMVRALLGSAPRRPLPIAFALPGGDVFVRRLVLAGAAGSRGPPSR